MRARVLLAVTLWARVAWPIDAEAPKLTAPSMAGPTAGDGAARPLPTGVVICVDRARQRCWSATQRDCEATGEVYAVVPAGSTEGEQLRACADQFTP